MNFLDAVQALKHGLCEGIQLPEWESNQMCYIKNGLTLADNSVNLASAIRGDWQLVNPKPVTETVEVKRWACICDGRIIDTANKKESLENIYTSGATFIELTGTYEKPVKTKVKMRQEAGTFYSGYDAGRTNENKNVPDDAKLFFEWEE